MPRAGILTASTGKRVRHLGHRMWCMKAGRFRRLGSEQRHKGLRVFDGRLFRKANGNTIGERRISGGVFSYFFRFFIGRPRVGAKGDPGRNRGAVRRLRMEGSGRLNVKMEAQKNPVSGLGLNRNIGAVALLNAAGQGESNPVVSGEKTASAAAAAGEEPV